MEFRKPEMKDKELITSYLKKYPSRSCERTFANILLWCVHYNVDFAEYKNTIIFRNAEAETSYALPVGADEDVKQVIQDLMDMAKADGKVFSLYEITLDNMEKLETWFPGMFQLELDRDSADYIYEAEKLATLSGKKLHGKRNHINKFKSTFEGRWSYEPLSKDNQAECLQMAAKWCKMNGCEEDQSKKSELCVTKNSIRLFEELELIGGALRVDGEIVAFTIGEAINEDTFVVHIEKAFSDVEGAYPMINQQFVANELYGKYEYVNREEDLGVEGLRKAKLSYKPAILLEKGLVTLK